MTCLTPSTALPGHSAKDPSGPTASRELSQLSYAKRMKRFGEAIDAIGDRAEAEMGARDVTRLRWLNRFSRGMEVVGRTLLHFSLEPVTFLAGVGALWIHKQLQTTEIGHTVLHGVYDHLD